MNVDTWLYQQLSTVTDLGGRITPEIGDQETAKPYAVYKLVSEKPLNTHGVPLMGTRHWDYQITVIAETDTEARNLAQLAKEATVLNGDGNGFQGSRLIEGGSGKHFDPETNDRENYFTISIWEAFS